MRTIHLTGQTLLPPCFAATIGFFDGVHKGHRYLVEQLREQAATHGLRSMIVTFDRHPRQVINSSWHPQLLSTLEEKEDLLRQTDIGMLVVLPFTAAMARLSARAFMRQVLKEQLGVRLLLTGYDNRFGHREQPCSEGFSDYEGYGREMGMDVVCAKPLVTDGQAVSSSLVRRLLAGGQVAQAACCLGRHYGLQGTVVHGEQNGRLMGFPTANIVPDEDRAIPANGVYAVWAEVGADNRWLPAMTNIGTRPTFGDSKTVSIETHILGLDADIYGQPLRIAFADRLRDERHFDSRQDLARQMALDAEAARQILTPPHHQPSSINHQP